MAEQQERDDLAEGLDRWELEMTVRLMAEYGHPYGRARALASISRGVIEPGLRKPMPLVVVTGI